MNNNEVSSFFIKNKDKKICGRFKDDQIDKKFTFNIPATFLYQKRSFYKTFLIALFVVMGSTLFSCRNFSGQEMGEVTVVDTLPITNTDTILEEHTVGESVSNPNHQAPKPKIDEIKFVKDSNFSKIMGKPLVKKEEDSIKVK